MLNMMQLPAEWSTLKKLIWLRGSPASGGMGSETLSLTAFAAPTLKTVTKKSKVTSCEVSFTPSQDLHGYDSPWPAGGGKNLFNEENMFHGYYSASFPSDLTADENYRTAIIDSLSAGTYTFSTTLLNTVILRIYYGEENHSLFVTANTYTFATTTTGKVMVCFRNTDTSTITETFNTQIESGSTATAWSPYSNLCPISGWQGAEVTVSGGNLINVGTPYTFTTTADIAINTIPQGTAWVYKDSFSYTVTPSSGAKYPYVVFYDSNNSSVGGIWLDPNNNSSSLTLTGDAVKVRIYSNGYNYGDSNGVEVTINGLVISMSQPTSYIPYRATTSSVTFGVQGKNLFDEEYEQGGGYWYTHYDMTGRVCAKNLFKVEPLTSYTVSKVGTNYRMAVQGYANTDKSIETNSCIMDSGWFAKTITSYTFTTGGNTHYVWIQLSTDSYATPMTPADAVAEKVMVELGSSATSYEPYRDYILGGTAEIVAGTGSEAWITFTLNGTQTRNNQKLDGAYNAVARWDLPVQAKAFTPGVPPYLCESLRAVSSTLIGSFQSWSDSESHAYTFTFSDDGRRVGIAIPKSVGISTAAELDTWLSNNPITFCYEVATPTPYTFPPASDQLLLQNGDNNAWAEMTND